MAARHFNVTLAAAAVRLSDAYGDGVGVVNPANDIPYRQILVSASGAPAYIGATTGVTSTDYGILVSNAATDVESIGPFETGPIKLSQLYAAGAGAVLHLLCIPF